MTPPPLRPSRDHATGPEVTPDEVLAECRDGQVRPFYLVVGEERLFADRVVSALREAATRGGVAGFNEEKFTAGETDAASILAAAQMLPMMAPRRFVLVRGADAWEKDAARADKRAEDGAERAGAARRKEPDPPLDLLDGYAKAPSPSTTMVVVASKLNGTRRIVKTAKAGGFLVECTPLKRREELASFVRGAARERGHAIDERAAARLAEIAGPALGPLDDAVERLSLYVGAGAPIGVEAVDAVVARIRESSVWDLVDALVARRLDASLLALRDVVDGNDSALPALGAIASCVRQLLKMDAAMRAGASPPEAAAAAGIPPFKAQDRAQALRRLSPRVLGSWPRLLAAADVACKSSRRSGVAILEETILAMCVET